jgi:hypothetical protein
VSARLVWSGLALGSRGVTTMDLRFWYSVYGALGDAPSPSAMSGCLQQRIEGLVHEFEPDDQHWRSGQFRLSGTASPAILVQRKLAGDDGFLGELEQAEDCLSDVLNERNGDLVLSQICRAQQIIHLVPCSGAEIDPATLAAMCEQLCGMIAGTSEGLIQVYQEGFFDCQGESLLPYRPGHRLQTA